MTVYIDDSNFQKEVLEADMPVLVVIYSDWCNICKKIQKYIDELKEEYEDILKISEANSEHILELISSLNITGMPTLLLYKKGNLIQRINGFHSKQQLKIILDKHLK